MKNDSDQFASTKLDRVDDISDELLESAMRQALEVAMRARRPFGAALFDITRRRVAYCRPNTTREDHDPFAHAEMNVLRAAAQSDSDLSNHILLSTAEPCPMCASAAIIGQVKAIAFGTSIATLVQLGWRQIQLPAATVIAHGSPRIEVRPHFLESETDLFYQRYQTQPYGGEQ
ncbi:tRNA-specific adenosine deaminase [Mycobacterium basiliense]|uniref:tRNA-specific adenosine deaminase n=1 Tax=Mycobacterium basiliense TaxID=2094119 RepID=A0A447G866_9MYCO|nr:nucleoside deaminase [Mycobacterium basiliense]VDM86571.1 tRNA-specific adenosine deaminase [Mycobacterium basiliense]